MKKVYLSLILMFLASIFILGCGGEEIATDKLKFKASNVVFRNSTVKASDEFTDQKVYADDVVLNNANTSLTADNVQGAFEETQPKLSEIIVGEWDVKAYMSVEKEGIDPNFNIIQKTGTITFNTNKTFSFTGIGQSFATNKDLNYNATPLSYNIYEESIIGITCSMIDNTCTRANKRSFTLITTNKLICEAIDNYETTYILTRKQ